MPYYDTTSYCNAGDQSTTGHYAVAKRPQNTAVVAGQLCRQFTAPTIGNERVFVCIVAGTTANVTDATWVLTRGAKTTDGTATWMECTGTAAINGDAVNTMSWAAARANSQFPTLGAVIKRNSGTSYQICTTASAMAASEPAFSDVAGVTTTDGSNVWTSLGVVGNFTGGQAPHARLANACANPWLAAGNTIFVGDNHAESQATAISIGPGFTVTSVSKIVCHNHSGSYPPTAPTTGATISITGAASFTFNAATCGVYFYGLTIKVGVGQSAGGCFIFLSTNGNYTYFDNCSLQIATTSGSSANIQLGGGNASMFVFNNTTVGFGNVAQRFDIQNVLLIWQNTGTVLASGSSVPTNLFGSTAAGNTRILALEALDLSQLTGNIVGAIAAAEMGTITIKDCKLNATGTIATPLCFGETVQLVRCDSGATGYKSARYLYEGTETTETTIVRTGGAADPAGQAQSRKIVTTANAQWLRPFKAEPYAIWNPTTGSTVTVTVFGTVNSYYLPFQQDIWLEVEYLGASSSPLGTMVTTTSANLLASNLPVTADTSVWSGVSLLTAADTPSPRTTYMTFDGAPTSVTLSNGNLTVTHGNTSIAGVNSSDFGGPAVGQVGVKQYFEITPQTSVTNGNSIGYMTPTDPTTAPPASGNNKTGVILGSASSIIYTPNGVSTGKDLGAVAVNDVIGVAYDGDNSLLWFRKNAGNWNGDPTANPATGAGGVFATIRQGYTPYVAFVAAGASTDVMKGNFGQTSFANTPPSGFGAADASGGGGGGGVAGWSSFKLVATLSSPPPQLAGYIHARVRVGKPSMTVYIDPKVSLS